MKKFIKFMSLLLVVPMLGVVSLLSGCGKDEVSLSKVIETYNNMVLKYQTANDDGSLVSTKNTLFTYTNSVVKGEDGKYNYFSNGSSFDVDYNIDDSLYLNKGASGVNGDLEILYIQLEDVYAKALEYSNLYFKQYQKAVFNEADAGKFDKEALGRLNNKIKNLDNALERFNTNMIERKELVDFFGADTKIMETKIGTFNSVYIDLISANYDFVFEFCNIHKNYVLNVSVEDSINNNSTAVAERLVYEGFLKYSYGYFLDNIKPFQNNNLANSAKLNENKGAKKFLLTDKVSELFTAVKENMGSNWKYRLPTDPAELENVNTVNKKNQLKTLASKLEQAIARFDVFVNLYNDNVSKFDMYTYNQLRHGSSGTMYENLNEFKGQLDAEQTARLTVIENFTTYDCVIFRDTILDVLKTN